MVLAGVLSLMVGLATGGSGHAADETGGGPVREIRMGLAAHDVDGLWSGSAKEDGPDVVAEVIFNRALFRLLTAAVYPCVGAGINTRGHTSNIYGGMTLQWRLPASFFVATGLGLALHDGERDTDSTQRKSLGSRLLFRIPIEIGYAIDRHHRLVIAFDHLSNAYLASPNEGMDTLALVYGYRF